MELKFWQTRWNNKQIGFHQSSVHPFLIQHWHNFFPNNLLGKKTTVFVPLCGKSLDMIWLQKSGLNVVGVELSDIAIGEFFQEQSLSPTTTVIGQHVLWQSPGYQLWQGDFFNLPMSAKTAIANVDVVFDRAALVALPIDMRVQYINTMKKLMPHHPPQMLISFDYEQAEMNGPPFAVKDDEVHNKTSGYGDVYNIKLLEEKDDVESLARFRARGVTKMTEKCFALFSNAYIEH